MTLFRFRIVAVLGALLLIGTLGLGVASADKGDSPRWYEYLDSGNEFGVGFIVKTTVANTDSPVEDLRVLPYAVYRYGKLIELELVLSTCIQHDHGMLATNAWADLDVNGKTPAVVEVPQTTVIDGYPVTHSSAPPVFCGDIGRAFLLVSESGEGKIPQIQDLTGTTLKFGFTAVYWADDVKPVHEKLEGILSIVPASSVVVD